MVVGLSQAGSGQPDEFNRPTVSVCFRALEADLVDADHLSQSVRVEINRLQENGK
jgi:hypothetical protein